MTTNPLTDERVVIHDCISDLVDSARFDVLRTLDQEPMTPSTIQNHGVLSRQTASDYITQLTERGLAKPACGQCGYEITAGGKLAVNAIESCLDELDCEQLAHLTRSPHSVQLLHTLATRSARPRDLAKTGASAPSRATVQRTLQMFAAQDWSTTEDGRHRLTPAGKRALDAYDDLAMTIEQVMEKAAWLQRLDANLADLPAHALADAEVVASGPDSPGIVLGAAFDLCNPWLNRFRTLTSIFNPTLFKAYNQLLKFGLPGEAIVDQSVYTHLYEEGMEHFLDDSKFDNFQIYRLEEPLTLGIGLYDDRKVAIGTYNETGEGDHIAMLVSSNDELVKWGTELFTSYREQALHSTLHPPESLRVEA